MQTPKITLGIIGIGRIGKIHIANITQHIPDAVIKAIADPQSEANRDWLHVYHVPTLTTDPEVIFSDPDIDAVFILSPTDTHTEYIERAARAKKAIFCEKPIGHSLSSIRQALATVEQMGVMLMIGFNRRFDHNFQRARQAVTSGEIGAPHIIKITSRDPAPPPLEFVRHSGGLFFDMTIHDWDMACFLAGDMVSEVYAMGEAIIDPNLKGIDIDTAVATLKFTNGAMALIDNSRQAKYGYDQRVEVFGSEGAVWVENDTPNSAKIFTKSAIYADKIHHFFLERYMQSYTDEIVHFFDCLRNHLPPRITGQDGLNAVLIAKAAHISLVEHRPVKLSELNGHGD